MYLIDTNIFLEVLLGQEKKEVCKEFLDTNIESLKISDFSFHSIGVILFRNRKDGIFVEFANDIIPKIEIVTLPIEVYCELPKVKDDFGLDFDDSYQFYIAKEHKLQIVTMDKDFNKAKGKIDVLFL